MGRKTVIDFDIHQDMQILAPTSVDTGLEATLLWGGLKNYLLDGLNWVPFLL